jgi:hypothetical protein
LIRKEQLADLDLSMRAILKYVLHERPIWGIGLDSSSSRHDWLLRTEASLMKLQVPHQVGEFVTS